MMKKELMEKIENIKVRSAWRKGVKVYAIDLVNDLECEELPETWEELKEMLLNGAENWRQYSWGGCALIYDCDIAELLCSPSELKRKKYGERKPNSREEWLDVQARALAQAAACIRSCFKCN